MTVSSMAALIPGLPAARDVVHQQALQAAGLNRSAVNDAGLRYSGSFLSRPEVADKIGQQLLLKRQLRARWLAEARQSDAAHAQAAQGFTELPAHLAGLPAVGVQVQSLIDQYRAYFARQAVRLSWTGFAHAAFASRRQTAERLLGRYFGLGGSELREAVIAVCGATGGGDDSGDLNADTGGHGGDASGQGGPGGNASQADAAALQADTSLVADGNAAVGDLRTYLLAEMALSDTTLTAAQRARAASLQSACFAGSPTDLQAAETVARLALERAESAGAASDTAARGSVNSSGPGVPAPVSTGVFAGTSLHELCNRLLSLYPADKLTQAVASLMSSVEAVGNRRSVHGDGFALSDILGRIRNLSVISLIMERTEGLKNRMLFANHTGKLPSDENLWRAICKVTQGRSIDPLLTVLREADLTAASRRLFLQGVQSILRELPMGVWSDPDNRGPVLSMMSEASGMPGARAGAG